MKIGITVISLCITIIILLILVGLSISALVGDNGILAKAADAIKETELAAVRESFEMALVAVQADYHEKKTTGEITVSESEYITIEMIRNNLPSEYQYCFSYSAEENTFDDENKLYDMSAIYLSKSGSEYGDTVYELSFTTTDNSISSLSINDVTEESILTQIEMEIDTTTTTSTTEDTDDVLLNPGKGFVLRNSMDSSYDDVVSIVYYRIKWCDIEPEEGEYDWDVIDEKIEECIERRQKICIWRYVCN